VAGHRLEIQLKIQNLLLNYKANIVDKEQKYLMKAIVRLNN